MRNVWKRTRVLSLLNISFWMEMVQMRGWFPVFFANTWMPQLFLQVVCAIQKVAVTKLGSKRSSHLGKPQKKKSSPTGGRATKRGGGEKAGPLRKKELFLIFFFFILLLFKNKNYFTYLRQLIEIWTYHVKVCR